MAAQPAEPSLNAWRVLEYAFTYSEQHPMIFTQSLFWFFFGLVLLVYQGVHRRIFWRNMFLLLFSFFFYYKASGFYFFLLVFSTIVDYFIGNALHRSERDLKRRFLAALSVLVNLSVLGYFKYTFFFADLANQWLNAGWEPQDYLAQLGNNLLGTSLQVEEIFLPVGISFYTFQTISYTIDIYRRQIVPVRSILDFAFYVSFFPQLVAGPIVRANEFVQQIYQEYRLTKEDYQRALFLIANGLVKKILISDYISVNFVDRVFQDPSKYSGFENLMGIYGYTIQIYCDFSGYTDIAIGIALLLGFRLPLNFNAPYRAVNITDFWRRWHISLSTWLRDYLYIPLGGNRKGKWRTYLNLLLTMLLGGLWHGAAMRFVIWGGLHGAALALHKFMMELAGKDRKKTPQNRFERVLSRVFTFHFVAFCWIFFRAPDMGRVGQMLSQIGLHFKGAHIGEMVGQYYEAFSLMLLAYVIHYIPAEWKNWANAQYARLPLPLKAVTMALLVLVLYQSMSAELQPFIYFQF